MQIKRLYEENPIEKPRNLMVKSDSRQGGRNEAKTRAKREQPSTSLSLNTENGSLLSLDAFNKSLENTHK